METIQMDRIIDIVYMQNGKPCNTKKAWNYTVFWNFNETKEYHFRHIKSEGERQILDHLSSLWNIVTKQENK